MIEVKHITKSFSDKMILNDISFLFERGKTNLIIGKSGAGKTVLMKSLIGLEVAEKGNILYDNRDFLKMSFDEKKELRKEIGMLFQGSALFDSMNVEENVKFPLDMFTNQTEEEKKERVNFCLQRVNIENSNKLLPSELSGGMKKRVAIARAIALRPKYLFCDEPNSGLDPQTANVIDNLIKEITLEFEMTTIINTHDMNSVFEMGDKIAFIYEGKLWWQGNKNEIIATDNPEVNEFIFSSELTRRLKG